MKCSAASVRSSYDKIKNACVSRSKSVFADRTKTACGSARDLN